MDFHLSWSGTLFICVDPPSCRGNRIWTDDPGSRGLWYPSRSNCFRHTGAVVARAWQRRAGLARRSFGLVRGELGHAFRHGRARELDLSRRVLPYRRLEAYLVDCEKTWKTGIENPIGQWAKQDASLSSV